MAFSKEEAYIGVLSHLRRKSADQHSLSWVEEYDLWKNHSVDDMPGEYTIEEFEQGEVCQGEIS